MVVASGALLFWTVQNQEYVRTKIKVHSSKFVKVNYGVGNTNATEMLINQVQADFHCCGTEGPKDWIRSSYNNRNVSRFEQGVQANLPEQGTYRIPPSCCDPDQRNCLSRIHRISQNDRLEDITGLYLEGCVEKFETFLQDKWQWILVAVAALIGVQVLALVFACCLCCVIARHDDDEEADK